jgi:hypothetical protein
MSRNSSILTRVRLRLRQIGLNEIQDGEIWDAINYMQNDIVSRTKCLEKTYSLNMVSGSNSYYFPNSASVYIKRMTNATDNANTDTYEMNYVMPAKWITLVSNASTDANLTDFTYFENKVSVYPTPVTSSVVTCVGYQTCCSYEITSSVEEPEIPSIYDNALVYGIISNFDPEFIPMYEKTLSDVSAMAYQKGSQQVNNVMMNW